MKLSRRRTSRRPFAVLDIGSSKICCMIGEIDKLGTLTLLGQGTHASAGMRAGEVTVLSDFSDAIGHCVQSAERAAGLAITSVSVVLPGGSPRSAFGTQSITLSDSTVSRRDVRRLLDRCGAQALDPTLQLMQLHPLHYSLDEMRGVADPTGMRGRTLSVDFLTVCATRTSLTNIIEALAMNHLGAERFIHAGYAAGLACLGDEERELGSTVIDLGGGTSSAAIFMDGKLIYIDTVPVGGQHVSTDIARILSTPLGEAERLKAVHGSITPVDAMASAPSPVRQAVELGRSDNITLPGFGDVIEAGGKTIERSLLQCGDQAADRRNCRTPDGPDAGRTHGICRRQPLRPDWRWQPDDRHRRFLRPARRSQRHSRPASRRQQPRGRGNKPVERRRHRRSHPCQQAE